MGMFDYVTCELPLPDGWGMENDVVGLQSKDFDCEMTTILIRADGRLLIERFEYYSVPKEERPYPDAEGALALCGSLGKKDRRWEDLNFHGDFGFGGLEDLNDDYWVASERHPAGGFRQKRYRHHDYVARFTDGHLVSIRDVTTSAIEAGTAETAKTGSVHESAVGASRDAQPQSGDPS